MNTPVSMVEGIDEATEGFPLEEISSVQPGTEQARQTREGNPEAGPPPPPPLPSGHPMSTPDRRCRWTAVCLGMLCTLLLVLAIRQATLSYRLRAERDQLLTNHSNLLEERDQLLNNHSHLLKDLSRPRCPTGWVVFGSSCYHNDQTLRLWSKGRRYCQLRGADLVLIKTPEKQHFLNEQKYSGWIGMLKKNGSWMWLDNTPVSTFYWHSSQPTYIDATCAISKTEWGLPNVSWSDAHCMNTNWAICEMPAFNCKN